MTAQSDDGETGDISKRFFVPVAHPMHLHGHDFVLLAQEDRPFHLDDLTNGTFKYDNPPRRDVALLPRNGDMAIGFKTDNPGLWILHCHIAWHASSGQALQIRENEHMINLTKEVVDEKDRVCENWRTWFDDKRNWFNSHEFQVMVVDVGQAKGGRVKQDKLRWRGKGTLNHAWTLRSIP